MNPKSSVQPPRGQNIYMFSLALSLIWFLVATIIHEKVPFPVLILFFSALADCTFYSFSDNFRFFRYPALASRLICGSLQILTGVAVAVNDLIVGETTGSLWRLVAIIFLSFGAMNIAELVSLWKRHTHEQDHARKMALQADQSLAQASREAVRLFERKEEDRKMQVALMDDLADYLNQPDSK